MYDFTDAELVNDCFDKLIAQGGCSLDTEHKKCQYRGPNGRKCAVGQYIPDNKYSENFEGNACYTLFDWGDKRLDIVHKIMKVLTDNGLNPEKFLKLQYMHDSIAENWPDNVQLNLLQKAKEKLLEKIESGLALENLTMNDIDEILEEN